MKKILVSMALATASFAVFAAPAVESVSEATNYTLCDGKGGKTSVWGGSGAVLGADASPVFTQSGFDVQCSANTLVVAQEVNPNLAVVGAGSVKGNQSFKSSSNGGAVAAHKKCTDTNDACQTSDIEDAVTQAISDAEGGGTGTGTGTGT